MDRIKKAHAHTYTTWEWTWKAKFEAIQFTDTIITNVYANVLIIIGVVIVKVDEIIIEVEHDIWISQIHILLGIVAKP